MHQTLALMLMLHNSEWDVLPLSLVATLMLLK